MRFCARRRNGPAAASVLSTGLGNWNALTPSAHSPHNPQLARLLEGCSGRRELPTAQVDGRRGMTD